MRPEEHKILVEPPMPDRSKSRGQMKCNAWSSRFEVGYRASEPTPEKFTVTKSWRRPRPTQGCSISKEEEENIRL
jgi:hypothetical protein